MSAEARSLIGGLILKDSDYVPTGLVLSVVIQLIAGDKVTEIHQLDKPAVVSVKLTEAQQKAISSDLAGVYYVNGDKAEYVGGTLDKGVFTFTAKHFSYYTILEYNKAFADLAGHWADKPVRSLAAKHIVEGVDDRRYEPNRSITRAEFVTLIMRSLGWKGGPLPEAAANPFSDVPGKQYYTDHIVKAAALGIVSGYNGAFRPSDTMTREEAAVALVQASSRFGVIKSGKDEPSFADMNEISDWAKTAVNEAWSKGLMEGDGVRFNPKQPVTRAEVAAMIDRLLRNGSL
nr:S-layer homology domain-containing protein [Paenibacillus hamazuiensis]